MKKKRLQAIIHTSRVQQPDETLVGEQIKRWTGRLFEREIAEPLQEGFEYLDVNLAMNEKLVTFVLWMPMQTKQRTVSEKTPANSIERISISFTKLA